MPCRSTWLKRVRTALLAWFAFLPAAVALAGNYEPVAEPVVAAAFLPLPPGAVEPAGWLRDWALAAREGLTGHLDEYHVTFRDAWKGIPINAPGAEPDATGWPLEQGAYWLDGALRLGFVLHDEALLRKIRTRLDAVVDGIHQADVGTSFIYWKKDYKPTDFNSWAHSQLGRALVALYQGTGDRRVLDALVKVYANYPEDMGPIEFYNICGVCNWDAMLETYALSGDQRILERVTKAAAQPRVAGDLQAWRDGRSAPGHTVVFYENIRLPALLSCWSGDVGQREATLAAYRFSDQNHLLPYGVASGEEYLSGIGAFRKTETCDVAAMLWNTSWMLRILGNGDWGDRMERAFFNAGAAPIARDFRSMCYYQSPNRLRSDSLPCVEPKNPGPDGNRFHQLGCPSVLCCVGASSRIIPSYVLHMWMATHDDGLAATLYGPCTVSALAGAKTPVQITTTTDYPFGETLRMRVEPEKDIAFPLYLRIPGWCPQARITVNGVAASETPDDQGFVKLTRTWTKGDVVELQFPMKPRVLRGFETEMPRVNRDYWDFMPEAIFQPRRLPFASVLYGPLLFALPIPDVDPNTPVADARWQYALDAEGSQHGGDIHVQRRPMPSRWDWSLDAPVQLTAPAQAFAWQPTDAQALPDGPVIGASAETIRLVPYGCTKFRVSMFPVTPKVAP